MASYHCQNRTIQQNTELFDFELSAADMETIDGMHGVAGLANDPDQVDF